MAADCVRWRRWRAWQVLDQPKLEGLPLGVMDSLELGRLRQPSSVAFHANVSEYLATLRAAQAQPKARWIMMQMTVTHPERRRVRSSFPDAWGDSEVRSSRLDTAAPRRH